VLFVMVASFANGCRLGREHHEVCDIGHRNAGLGIAAGESLGQRRRANELHVLVMPTAAAKSAAVTRELIFAVDACQACPGLNPQDAVAGSWTCALCFWTRTTDAQHGYADQTPS
jgi:hypothetical protein